MTDLRPHVESFLGELFARAPVFATQMGDHRFDDRWPDYSDPDQAADLAMLARWEAMFAAMSPSELSADDQIDRDLLVEEIGRMRFGIERLAEHRWNALGYVYLAGGGLFQLLARDFAPLADRMGSFAGRVERLPKLLGEAAGNLTGVEGGPVSLLHLETALAQLDGLGHLIDEAIAEGRSALDRADDRELGAAIGRIEGARPAALAAIGAFRRHLEETVRPRAEGEGRLGSELFQEKLRWTLRSDLSPAELFARAERDQVLVTAEMLRLAREAWSRWVPDEALPTAAGEGTSELADRRTIRRVLDAIAREHPAATELLDRFREESVALEGFIGERRLLAVPDEPLEIIWTPLFLRSFGGAYLDAPGPLERGQTSFFGVTPPPDDATPEQVESQLREMNDRLLKVVTIHETTPGHYLQLWYSNRHGTLTRAVFSSDVFAEGWAVYVTQVLMDLGYGGDDPALLLSHWKFYLRAIINTLLDLRVHAGVGEPIDEAEAMRLMTEDGFQEEAEARAKWNRARLSSTQLSTYYVGSTELWDVEMEARRRAAAAVGHTGPMPVQRVVGDLGDTPGFSYAEHLEAVLSHGSPPIRTLRRILFGTPTMPA